MHSFQRLIASALVVSTCLLGLPMRAQATMVSTDTVIAHDSASSDRSKVLAYLDRDDVRQQLQAHGLNAQDAAQRVRAMSDSEVAQLAGRVDQAPAGGDILGLAFTLFLILLVTDILGLTKVFPFTRSVR